MSEFSPKISEINIRNPHEDFGFIDAYSYKAQTPEEKELGNLYIVTEINDDLRFASSIIETLITTFRNEYYRTKSPDIFESFKEASHRTNEALASLAEGGNVTWIGNLHAIIAVQRENEVHVTVTGKGKAFLVRNNQMTEISEGLASPFAITNPLKTFTDVSSGEILSNDKFIFATPALFEILPEERILRIIGHENPEKASFAIQTLIKKSGIENVKMAAIIINMEKRKKEEERIIEVPILEEHSKRKPKLTPEEIHEKLKPKNIFITIFSFLGVILIKTFRFIFGVIKSVIKKSFLGVKFIVLKIKEIRRKRKEEIEIKIEVSKEETPISLPKSSNEIFIKEEEKKRPFRLILLSLWKKIPSSSKILLLITLIFIILFVGSLFLLSHKKKVEKEVSMVMDMINLAENKVEKSETAMIYNDEDKARGLLNEASGLVEKAKESKRYQEEIGKLSLKIREKQDTINHIVRVQDAPVLGNFSESFPGVEFSYIAVIGDKIYTFNPQNNSIYRLDPASKNVDTVFQKSQGIGYFKAAAALPTDKMILFLTNTPGLASFDTKNNDILPLEIKFGDKQREIISFAAFSGRLYFLDKKNNELLGFTKTLSGYIDGYNWLKNKVDLERARDLAIDGYVYLLYEDGRVERFLKGVKKDIKTPSLSKPLQNPTRLFLNEKIKHMYILEPEGKRVVVMDTLGNLKNQYIIENATKLRDIFIDDKEENMYLLDDGKVLKVEIK